LGEVSLEKDNLSANIAINHNNREMRLFPGGRRVRVGKNATISRTGKGYGVAGKDERVIENVNPLNGFRGGNSAR